MRIGILTFHRAVNYGACLQAYALKRYIENKKLDVQIIDYRSKYIEDLYSNPFSKGTTLKTKIRNCITWNIQKERNNKFNNFISEYLQCNEKTSIFDKSELKKIESSYDKIIVGSDQVWSTLCTSNDTTYYLDFLNDNKKKFSYAASFGIISNDFHKSEKLKSLLSKFTGLSVRENIGYEVIKKMIGRESTLCVDPTFLLKQEDWKTLSMSSGMPSIGEKYILVYSLSMPQSIVDYAEDLSKKMKLKVIYFTLNNLFSLKNKRKVINGSPIDFINYFANSQYVITNSFHGTAFSLIFNKDFTVFKNSNKKHDNSRLENILSLAGLKDRMINEGEKVFFEGNIDYSKVNNSMNAEIEKSKEYLESIFKVGDKNESKYKDN